jgi:hypothetical protein
MTTTMATATETELRTFGRWAERPQAAPFLLLWLPRLDAGPGAVLDRPDLQVRRTRDGRRGAAISPEG